MVDAILCVEGRLQLCWEPERMIVPEFPSEAHVSEWLSSPEYLSIVPLREAEAEMRAILLEGYLLEE